MSAHVNPNPLRDSLYFKRGGVEFKSCPSCSRMAGRPIFYPTADFGDRQIAPGQFVPQTWCGPCRNYKQTPSEAS